MRMTVTGPTGHVGAALVRLLLERGHQVRAVIFKDGPALDGLDIEKVPGNVLDPDSLQGVFADTEMVFHLAGMITIGGDSTGLVRRVNTEGVRNVAEACLRCGVQRMIHFSSVHALSPFPVNAPVTEERPLSLDHRVPVYDRTKAEGEDVLQAVIQRGLDAVIINPTGIMGPFDFEGSHMGHVLLDLYHQRIPALVDGGFNWADVRDVCLGTLAAAEKGRRGERYLLGGHWHHIRDIAAMTEEETGVPAPRHVLPLWLAGISAPMISTWDRWQGRPPQITRSSIRALRFHQQIDYSKAQRELDYCPRPIRETIRDTFAWFRERGMLEPVPVQ